MKTLLFCFLPGIFMLPVNKQITYVEKTAVLASYSPAINNNMVSEINFQDQQEPSKMLSVVFKNQDYCRVEIPDFEWEVKFNVVRATVYFTGPNFNAVEKGTITSNSLKPIKELMKRCSPGARVVFDDIRVLGPDNLVRPIAGLSLLLH